MEKEINHSEKLKRYEEYFKQKMKMLKDSIELTKLKTIERNEEDIDKLNKKLKKKDISSETLKFADELNQTCKLLQSSFLKKTLLFVICEKIQKFASKKLTKESSIKAKKSFDLICNYKKRKEEGLDNIGYLYDEDLCYYLIKKCFKKSATDAFDSFLRFNVKNYLRVEEGTVRIVSVGGGPGSDLSGTVAYLVDIGHEDYKKYDCKVLDFNFKNWSNSSKKFLTEEFKKWPLIEDFKLGFNFIDFSKPETLDEKNKEDLRNANIVTIFWAINEAVIEEDFWNEFFNLTENSIVIIVEGKEDKLKELIEIHSKLGEKKILIFEEFESPRRFISLPNIS